MRSQLFRATGFTQASNVNPELKSEKPEGNWTYWVVPFSEAAELASPLIAPDWASVEPLT